MENIKIFLEGASAVPYNDSIIDLLDQTCHEYSINDDLKLMDSLATCLMSHRDNPLFHKSLNDAISQEGTYTRLPFVVVYRLIAYKCYILVMEEENKLRQALMATIFMNSYIYLKASRREVCCEDLLNEIYEYHISKYIEDIDNTDIEVNSSLIKMIAKSESPSEEIFQDDSSYDEDIKKIAKSAAFYQYDSIVAGNLTIASHIPYVQIYAILQKFVQDMGYNYYNYPIYNNLISKFDQEEISKNKTLKQICKFISNARISSPSTINLESSAILHLMSHQNDNAFAGLQRVKLSAKEFLVYVYYELLAEKILNELNEEKNGGE